MNTLPTLTIDEAIEIVPAIGATAPADNVSHRYQFVSTRDILGRVDEYGWKITNVSAQSQAPTAQHRITLVHENDLTSDKEQDGIPRIEMFNSHNRTKRLMFAIGYFRFVCSNGLIVASGPAETIRTKHRFSGDRLAEIMDQVSNISGRFPKIKEKITQFQDRALTDFEMNAFARYAVRGRFNYRPEMPKRFAGDMGRTVEKLLTPRRDADAGNNTWQVYNRVQENLMKGIEGFARPLQGYSDSVRVNQLLWKGAETTLMQESTDLERELTTLLIKDGKKGKIAA
jgi:hypothetical protein